MVINITPEEAKRLVLSAQMLGQKQVKDAKADALTTIEHLGYVQIDTLSVVTRAHHHTLWSRLPDCYAEAHLHELLAYDKTIFEYWSHAASYLPMRDFRFSLLVKEHYASGGSHWFEQDKRMNQFVLDRITAEGALQSKDFEGDKGRSGQPWYEWKSAKRALEQMFMEGRLMVSQRKGFQKVYDLSERVLPEGVNTAHPTPTEYGHYLVQTALRANGLCTESEIYYLRPRWKNTVRQVLQQGVEAGNIVEVAVEGYEKERFYALPDVVARALNNSSSGNANPQLHLLSPFDNLVIQRKRLLRWFGFDYIIECYVPEPKRKFGYFVLPVLWGNTFIGRLDPKADRKAGKLYVKKWFAEAGAPPEKKWLPLLQSKLLDFARFNACDEVVFENE
jgi:uncharacterized protein YcaQ